MYVHTYMYSYTFILYTANIATTCIRDCMLNPVLGYHFGMQCVTKLGNIFNLLRIYVAASYCKQVAIYS